MATIEQLIDAARMTHELWSGADIYAGILKKLHDLKVEELAAAIEAGETTGDQISDYVIVTYRDVSGTLEAPFRELDQQLRGSTGQLALIHSHYSIRSGSKQNAQAVLRSEEAIAVGLIDSTCDGLAFRRLQAREAELRWCIPTREYVITARNYPSNLKIFDGPMTAVEADLATDLVRPDDDPKALLERRERELASKSRHGHIEIRIGFEAVSQWFHQHCRDELFGKMLRELNYTIPT